MTFKFIVSFLTAAIFGTSLIAETVDDAQRMLNQLGYNAGPVDGAYGRKTKAALEKLYSSMGENFNGKLDANEIANLESATSKRGDFRDDLFLSTLGIDTSAGDNHCAGSTIKNMRDLKTITKKKCCNTRKTMTLHFRGL